MLIDSHAHVNFEAFNSDSKQVIDKCLAQDVWVINVGSNLETSKKAIEIAEGYDGKVFAAVGLHPIHARDDFKIKDFKSLVKSEKVVAIGEIGLDRFKDYGLFFDEQKRIFLQQLDLAKELNLPVIIHCRMAHKEMIEVLEGYSLNGVIHCFTGTWEEAEKYLNLGYYLGINGIMYKFDLKEVIQKASLGRLLLETDCPYLGPNKEERNEPVFVKKIAEDVARIKNISFDEVASATVHNAKALFGI